MSKEIYEHNCKRPAHWYISRPNNVPDVWPNTVHKVRVMLPLTFGRRL